MAPKAKPTGATKVKSSNLASSTPAGPTSIQAIVSALPRDTLEQALLEAPETPVELIARIRVLEGSKKWATKKRANDEVTKQPSAKRTKVIKPLDFKKLEEKAGRLVTSKVAATKTQEDLQKLIETIKEEVDAVDDQEVRQRAMLSLSAIFDSVFGAELSTKGQELIEETGFPSAVAGAMVHVAKLMSEGEKEAFIGTDGGMEWLSRMDIAEEYGEIFGGHLDELLDFFP